MVEAHPGIVGTDNCDVEVVFGKTVDMAVIVPDWYEQSTAKLTLSWGELASAAVAGLYVQVVPLQFQPVPEKLAIETPVGRVKVKWVVLLGRL